VICLLLRTGDLTEFPAQPPAHSTAEAYILLYAMPSPKIKVWNLDVTRRTAEIILGTRDEKKKSNERKRKHKQIIKSEKK
jgi:hypothetical protein